MEIDGIDYKKLNNGDYGGSVILERLNPTALALVVSIFTELLAKIIVTLAKDGELEPGDRLDFRIKTSKPWLN